MADPSTEINTSMSSNITFAASPSPKKGEDTATLLQLELVEHIKEYKESGTAPDTKKKKKSYRSGRGDIGFDKSWRLIQKHNSRYYSNTIR